MTEDKLSQDVRRFLEVYKVLSPDAKAAFEAQLAPSLNDADQRTRMLYSALLGAAREGLDINQAISKMEEAARGGQSNQPEPGTAGQPKS